MKKLLVISGPTATGKTELALALAKKLNGELISADSRQVYKGMDIGTGKDVPEDFMFIESEPGYYTDGKARIWGYDLVPPEANFSVSEYLDFAHQVIADIHSRSKLPILVGGTGLYVKAVIEGINTASTPRNPSLRANIDNLSVEHLYKKLEKLDSQRATLLNNSDRKNPRRLIRAIEVAKVQKNPEKISPQYDCLKIGLNCPIEELSSRIAQRVKKRLVSGFEKEVHTLIKHGITKKLQSMQTPGYREWMQYLIGEINCEEANARWQRAERQYAKRQKTWFKKQHGFIWFSACKGDLEGQVEARVKRWYAQRQ
ncbi:tRNA (adenosine(37)-N6)-dimethylallyltransferase MiaA [Candidatus Woesebacteria bacterium RIFCSPHIGHO2_01_FULL_41_10]|uniref:tRNA dimethylallyltransferase n=1 Tax=Candidatus Woesebacteria bacterium RIFCSPHIGHO2_01_FULL_41_10 TaxID=1802500 RepID=A0A1F7YSK0_9BACT|nr:MAG: tRNA (adenosine(37)-N6)-dimethylallyltransferase MiaA [Candidatus Woesebacteria bacterium RIFCSPHIGHO2_01_FULL_41_10]